MIQRRQAIISAASVVLAPVTSSVHAAINPGVSDTELLFGQSIVTSGAMGTIIKDQFTAGAQLHFDDVNRRGGMHGRRIQLLTLDDGFQVERTVANVRTLLQDHKVFGLFGGMGNAAIQAILPLLRESDTSLVGSFAVGDSVREQARGSVYIVRATYQRELERVIQHITTIGLRQVGLLTLATAGGDEIRKIAQAEIASRPGLNLIEIGRANPNGNGSDVSVAAAKQCEAIIMFASPAVCAGVIGAMLNQGTVPPLYAMSIVAADILAKMVGSRLGAGLTSVQVVPYPWSEAEPQAQLFRKLVSAAKGASASYVMFEGYVNAMVLTEALRRCGRNLRREGFHRELQRMKTRIAGMDVAFNGGATGSRFVELVHCAGDGRFSR